MLKSGNMFKFKFIYKFIPVLILFTNKLQKDWTIGRSFGVFVVIRPEHKDNNEIIDHEIVHCKQFYRTFGVHAILYSTVRSYRLKAELEAYETRIQTRGYKYILNIVNLLFDNYDLNMSREYITTESLKYYSKYKL